MLQRQEFEQRIQLDQLVNFEKVNMQIDLRGSRQVSKNIQKNLQRAEIAHEIIMANLALLDSLLSEADSSSEKKESSVIPSFFSQQSNNPLTTHSEKEETHQSTLSN